MLVFLDWNSTLGQPQTKERLMRHLGLPVEEFGRDFDEWWNQHIQEKGLDPEAAGRIKRVRKIEYLVDWLRAKELPPITRTNLRDFGRGEKPYDGAWTTLNDLRRQAKESGGVDVHFAVCTNAWVEIIGQTSLFRGRNGRPPLATQLFGQQLKFDPRGVLTGPLGVANAEHKPAALRQALKFAGVTHNSACVVVGNGFSDWPVMKVNRIHRGVNVGVFDKDMLAQDPSTSLEPGFARRYKHATDDFEQMQGGLTDGINGSDPTLDAMAPNNWDGPELCHQMATSVALAVQKLKLGLEADLLAVTRPKEPRTFSMNLAS